MVSARWKASLGKSTQTAASGLDPGREAVVIGSRRDAVIARYRAFREHQRARLVAVGMRRFGVVRERRLRYVGWLVSGCFPAN